jgi:hypothetical protein
MTGRVLLGNRGGQYGLFVSKANKEVTNTSLHEDDLIFSTSGRATSTTVTKPATFSNSGITNTNQSSNYKFAAVGDIF